MLDPTIRSAPKTSRVLSNEQSSQLRALPYAAYLRTPWWFSRRNKALQDVAFRCQRCGTKRQLQVHHTSYQRLGAELDSDLEVLCRGCHTGEHFNEVQIGVGIYARIISDVLSDGAFVDVSDVLEEAKARCSAARIPIHHEQFHAAAARLINRVPFTPPKGKEEFYAESPEGSPLTRAEASGILARLGVASLVKHVPQVRPLTERELDRRHAMEIVAQAIRYQAARCDEVEREAEQREAEHEEPA